VQRQNVSLKPMAGRAVFTTEQYLQISFDGLDREAVNGEVVESYVGGKPHGEAQVRLVEIFYKLRQHSLYSAIELRISRPAESGRCASG
jgi:hypothetical protein